MKNDLQLDFFESEVEKAPGKSVPTPKKKIRPAKKTAKTKSGGHNLPAEVREAKKMVTEFLTSYPQSYHTVMLPDPILAVFPFPVVEQPWKATHPTKHYSLETGVSEGRPDLEPKVITIKDWGYFLALYSLVTNTPTEDLEQSINIRHVAYVMQGFPELSRSLGNSNIVNKRFSDEFGRAMDKAFSRHLFYTVPASERSSAPGDKHWLDLLSYKSTESGNIVPGNKNRLGRYYYGFHIGSGFHVLEPDKTKWREFDLKLFFAIRKWTSRAVYLKLLPRLLAGRYEKFEAPLSVDAVELFEQIGENPTSFNRPARAKRKLIAIAADMDCKEGALGTRLRARVRENLRGKPFLELILEKTEAREKQDEFAGTKTFQEWIRGGGTRGAYRERFLRGRKLRRVFDENDYDCIRSTGLSVDCHRGFLTLTKQILGTQEFRQVLGDFRSGVSEGRCSNHAKALAGYLLTRIREVAGQAEN